MFECYFLKMNISNNKNCKKVHNNLEIESRRREENFLTVTKIFLIREKITLRLREKCNPAIIPTTYNAPRPPHLAT